MCMRSNVPFSYGRSSRSTLLIREHRLSEEWDIEYVQLESEDISSATDHEYNQHHDQDDSLCDIYSSGLTRN